MIAVGGTLLSSYENIPFGFTPPVFGILDPDASHRPTGSTTGYALRSG